MRERSLVRFWALSSQGVRWLRAREPVMLLAALLLVLGLWGFIQLADEVTEGDSHAMDNAILAALKDPQNPRRPAGPHWFVEAARDLTSLGGIPVIPTYHPAYLLRNPAAKRPTWQDIQQVMELAGLR